MMKTVSVQIVTFNSAAHIEACLQAVFNQTYPLLNIVVIDNASRDDTRALLSPYQGQIHIVHNEVNTGFAPAHNQALALTAPSDYVLVLNPDVVLDSRYVEAIVHFGEANPQVGGMTGQLVFTSDPDMIDSTGLVITKSRRAFDRGAGERKTVWSDSAEVFGVSGAAAIYKRTMIEQIAVEGQFFDEDFFAYKEDVDVSWRGRLYGWKFYYVAAATAKHVRHWQQGSRQSQPAQVRAHSLMNRIFAIIKNDSPRYYLKHILRIVGFDLASMGYVLLRERELLRPLSQLIRLVPRMMRKRKQIQAQVKVEYPEIYQFFK